MRSLRQIDRDIERLFEHSEAMHRMVADTKADDVELHLGKYLCGMVDLSGEPYRVVVREMLEMEDEGIVALLGKLPPDQREPMFRRVMQNLRCVYEPKLCLLVPGYIRPAKNTNQR